MGMLGLALVFSASIGSSGVVNASRILSKITYFVPILATTKFNLGHVIWLLLNRKEHGGQCRPSTDASGSFLLAYLPVLLADLPKPPALRSFLP